MNGGWEPVLPDDVILNWISWYSVNARKSKNSLQFRIYRENDQKGGNWQTWYYSQTRLMES